MIEMHTYERGRGILNHFLLPVLLISICKLVRNWIKYQCYLSDCLAGIMPYDAYLSAYLMDICLLLQYSFLLLITILFVLLHILPGSGYVMGDCALKAEPSELGVFCQLVYLHGLIFKLLFISQSSEKYSLLYYVVHQCMMHIYLYCI